MSARLNRARLWRYGAIAAAIAAIVNLVILGIGRAAGVSFIVPMFAGTRSAVGPLIVVINIAIWSALGLLVTMLVASRQPRRLRAMQVVAIVVTVVSLIQPAVVDADTATRVLLAIMHPVTGAAFVLGLRRLQAETEGGDVSQAASATSGA
jgi:hypothetical protein